MNSRAAFSEYFALSWSKTSAVCLTSRAHLITFDFLSRDHQGAKTIRDKPRYVPSNIVRPSEENPAKMKIQPIKSTV